MANKKVEPRLPPIMHAYLEDLANLGAYGRGKTGVAKRFIEDGIQAALTSKVIAARSIEQFEEDEGEEDDD